MVKDNNILPIEVNNKPFETVQEVGEKYGIPSYEEFMKNYESDDSLNYADLSDGDIGEVKGHGPCYVCNKPTKWIDLYMSCPGVNDSGEKCTNTRKTYWYHSKDSRQTQISNKSYIRCSYCSSNYHMSQWVFSCSQHRGDY
jgi:DNA-directed RNA polymerase subunit RPC12/RpoP